MEKISCDMDLEDWEVLSQDGFLDFKQEDSSTKEFLPRELTFEFDPKAGRGVDVNYFICPSPRTPSSQRRLPPSPHPSPHESIAPIGRDGVVPVPIQLDPTAVKSPCLELGPVKDISEVPMVVVSIVAPAAVDMIKNPNPATAADQVFFKKMKENEFVDMKMDSPRSSSNNSRGLKTQLEVGSVQFEDKEAVLNSEDTEHKPSKMPIEEEKGKKYGGLESGDDGLSIWNWRGIGALCSLGLAAATICIFIFSGHQRHKHQDRNNQKFRFQIYADDKRIKQVVHHATRLNQALSAVRGVPLVRAHITFGGYYDGVNTTFE